jgi:hypothetical protein
MPEERLMEKTLMTQLHAAAHQLLRGVVCTGTGRPGQVALNGRDFQCASGEWWVIDGPAWDELLQALARGERELDDLLPDEAYWVTQVQSAVHAMRQNLVLSGWGPVAPTFDEFDREIEARRGSWYVIEGRAYPAFRSLLEQP